MNMMGAENLAIVLAPTLMSSSYTDPMSCLAGAKFEQAIIERMIVYFQSLFDHGTNANDDTTDLQGDDLEDNSSELSSSASPDISSLHS